MIAPGPGGLPLLGSLLELGKGPIAFLSHLASRFGDVARFRFGRETYHLLLHPDHVQHVLQTNGRNYTKQTRGFRAMRAVLGNGLVTSDGSFWLRQRRIAQPAFHKQRVAAFGPIMTQAALAMCERWEDGSERDIHAEMMRLTLQIAGETLLSTDVVGEAKEVGEAVTVAIEEANRRIYSPVSLPLWFPSPRHRAFRRALATLDGVVAACIGRRRAEPGRRADVLSLLMEARDEETGEAMDDRQLRDEVMTMFLAGHETTANALAWTWMLLSLHPEAQRRLAQELGAGIPEADDLPKLRFLTAVLQESMRLYPPAWIISRQAVEPDTIGGYDIPADSGIFLCPFLTHRQPAFWREPDRFDPERFLGAGPGHRYAYLPFGGGQRQCIGSGFAMNELALVLATVARRWRLELTGEPAEPEPTLTLRPRGRLMMRTYIRNTP